MYENGQSRWSETSSRVSQPPMKLVNSSEGRLYTNSPIVPFSPYDLSETLMFEIRDFRDD